MKKLKLLLLLAGLMLALWIVGCTSTTTTEPAAPVTTFSVENADGTKSAEIVLYVDGTWSCSITNCSQNRQIENNTFHFFDGTTEIAIESGNNLEMQNGWVIVSEVTH